MVHSDFTLCQGYHLLMGDNLLTGRGLGPEGILFIQNLASEAHSPLPKLECFEDSRGWCKIDRSFKI